MVEYKLVYTKQALKDAKKVGASNIKAKVQELLSLIEEDPFIKPPPYEKLIGDLQKAYSRRINLQHRLIYEVIEDIKTIKIIRMWSHYGE